MKLLVDTQKLFYLLKDYYAVTNLRVGVYDLACQEIAAYPVRQSGFCKVIRGVPQGLALCKQCDSAAFEQAHTLKTVYSYRCHAGLTEAVAPILEGGEVIGYIMIGQMRECSDEEAQWQRLAGSFTALGIDVGYLRGAFCKLKSVTPQEIQSYSHILQACAAYIWLDHYVQVQREDLPKKLEQYINQNLSEKLSLQTIAQHLGVGKTTLCSCARENFGVPVGEMILQRRLACAKRLLRETDLPISTVAEQVGVEDYNYFSRIFKARTQLNPREYRKSGDLKQQTR